MNDGRIRHGLAAYFIAATLVMIWPIYPVFSLIEPRLGGLPFGLVWILIVLVFSFFVLTTVYIWESKTGRLDD